MKKIDFFFIIDTIFILMTSKNKKTIFITIILSLLSTMNAKCLCIFDIDRTLTGLQEDIKDCPNNLLEPNIPDCGYAGGNLTLSVLAQK